MFQLIRLKRANRFLPLTDKLATSTCSNANVRIEFDSRLDLGTSLKYWPIDTIYITYSSYN